MNGNSTSKCVQYLVSSSLSKINQLTIEGSHLKISTVTDLSITASILEKIGLTPNGTANQSSTLWMRSCRYLHPARIVFVLVHNAPSLLG